MREGYILKLNWAIHRLKELTIQSGNWFTPERYPVVHESDPDGPYKLRVRITQVAAVPADPFSLLIGDVLYSLRSGLDNLAFVLNGGTTEGIGNESEFPIYGNQARDGSGGTKVVNGETAHRGQFVKKVRGMDKAAQTFIEGLQPYKRGNGYRDHPLWTIDSLCNMDKHRAIHIVAGRYAGVALVPHLCENLANVNPIWTHMGLLKTNAVVVRYTPVAKVANREVKVQFFPIAQIGFEDGPLSGRPVLSTLLDLCNYVARDVVEPLAKFIK